MAMQRLFRQHFQVVAPVLFPVLAGVYQYRIEIVGEFNDAHLDCSPPRAESCGSSGVSRSARRLAGGAGNAATRVPEPAIESR